MISYYIYLQQCLSFVPSFYLRYVSGLQIRLLAPFNILLVPLRLRMGGLQNLFVKLSFGILVIGTIMKFNRRRYYCKSKHMVTLMTTKVAHITVFPMNESGRV